MTATAMKVERNNVSARYDPENGRRYGRDYVITRTFKGKEMTLWFTKAELLDALDCADDLLDQQEAPGGQTNH